MGMKYKPGMELGPKKILLIQRTKRVGSHYYGLFKCPYCQTNFECRINNITSGHTQSCGCFNDLNRIKIGQNNAKNIAGQKFGYLTAIEPTKERSQRKIKWKCRCDRGTIVNVVISDLLNGHTQSCGCLRSKGESLIKAWLIQHDINFIQEHVFSDCVNPKTQAKLRFDFYLPDYNCCIECQGMQHYYPIDFFGGEEKFYLQQTLDKIKDQYCQENNLILIKISYKEEKDINFDEISSVIWG